MKRELILYLYYDNSVRDGMQEKCRKVWYFFHVKKNAIQAKHSIYP